MAAHRTTRGLSRSEILAFAVQARLIIREQEDCYLNELATEKELMTFVRLLESWQADTLAAHLIACIEPLNR